MVRSMDKNIYTDMHGSILTVAKSGRNLSPTIRE